VKDKYSKSLKTLNSTLPMDSRKWDAYRCFYAFENLFLNTAVQRYLKHLKKYVLCTVLYAILRENPLTVLKCYLLAEL